MTTGTPPMRSMSTMWYLPCGLVSAMCGTRAATLLKSSSASSTRASAAMASRCSTALVEPPSAMVTAMAFSNASFVMICRGRMPSSSSRTTAWPDSKAKSSRRLSGAGGDDEPGSDMPMASATDAIVLAVNMPAQLPSLGQAPRSMSSELGVVDGAGGVGADRLEHRDDVDGLALVLTRAGSTRRRGTPPAG